VTSPVRAAGGVLWRRRTDGAIEVLLVHRPRYDDWSFPKGKCDRGEADEACALREVEEETGLVGEIGAELPEMRYVDGRGRDKVVRYWAMRVAGGDGGLRHEVDEVVWLAADEAAARLSYDRDRTLLPALSAHLDPP
jgi:8-oxo-dGTP pyrophosphatase MutT (NUDIX family)